MMKSSLNRFENPFEVDHLEFFLRVFEWKKRKEMMNFDEK